MGRKERTPAAAPTTHGGERGCDDSARCGRQGTPRRPSVPVVGADSRRHTARVPSDPSDVVAERGAASPRSVQVAVEIAELPEAGQRRIRADVVRAVAVQLRKIADTCDFAADCGYSPALSRCVLAALDDSGLAELRDAVAASIGEPAIGTACTATICSSRWASPRKAAGTDAGGKAAKRNGRSIKNPASHGGQTGKGA